MKKSFGIVLKKNPHKNTCVLLDNEHGKIIASTSSPLICTGAAFYYVLNPLHRAYHLDNLELLYVPFSLAREDILFLHHVLELCSFIMQTGQPAHELLARVLFLYRSPDLVTGRVAKKIFLSTLFIVCGLYPENPKFHQGYFARLAVESLDTLLNETIELEVEKELDDWLYQCIATHPEMRHLKTIHFLVRNKTL